MPKRLGKGLKALIPEYSSNKDRYIDDEIPVDNIVPNKNQPRQYFSNDALEELINSINENGILQPLTLRELENEKYELIAGERRLRAAKQVGLKTVPGYVISIETDMKMLEYALVENIQRENLNPIEEAEGYALLSGKYNLTPTQIAKKVGKNRSTISNSLRLLKLPPIIKRSLRDKKKNFTSGHARALLKLRKSTQMLKLFNKITNHNLSVRNTEELASEMLNLETKVLNLPIRKRKSSTLWKYENDLISIFGTKVQINKSKNGNGKITISFTSKSDLERILELISNIKN